MTCTLNLFLVMNPLTPENTMKLRLLALLALTASFVSSAAQDFTSGSNGSYGAINVTANTTLPIPPDGIFHATTINIAAGRTLNFTKNAANTPVYLLATGNVTIAGTIDVSGGPGNNVTGGQSGPGGFNGGSPGSISVPPGAGYGPGGGRGGAHSTTDPNAAGSGAFAAVGINGPDANKGAAYGSALLIPMIGGSGGGGSIGTPGGGGGGGGGAILIASSTRIDLTGDVRAYGGSHDSGVWNGGSGGAIRLVAPVVAGNGRLIAINTQGVNAAGVGRIRVDAVDRSQMNFQFFQASATSVGSLMLVFPSPLPRLDIIEAAGTAIPEGSGPVTLNLPFGSSPNRSIRVQARDFNATVPVTLVLTPDHGTPLSYSGTINNAAANPAAITFNVVLPVNEQVTVNAYSK